jgi:excisionase family DNA binding protein
MNSNRTAYEHREPTHEALRHHNPMSRTLRFDDLPDVLCYRDLRAFLPIGRNALYEALKSQRIRNVRIGAKYLISKAALREFLSGTVE